MRMSWNDNVLSWANQTKSKTNNYFTIATKGNYVINVFEEKRSDNSSVVRVQGASPDGMHFEFLENGNICLKRFSSKPSDMANISAVFMGAASGNSADQSSSRICTPSVRINNVRLN